MNNNKIYLINNKILNKYKEYLEFEIISKFLKNKKNNIFINYKNGDDIFPTIINELNKINKEYFDKIKKKEIFKELKFNENDYVFNIKYFEINYPYKQKLSYIIDFDIIDEEVFLFFLGNYIVGDGKILIIFKGKNNTFYEIGYFDSHYNFIIEYLIQEINSYKNEIVENFNQKGIEFFFQNYLKDNNKNEINIDGKAICKYYKIKENNINNNFNYQEDEKIFIENIINILLLINFFEKEIKNKLEESKNKNCIFGDCYIINKNILLKIKHLFLSDKIEDLIKKYILKTNYDIKTILY